MGGQGAADIVEAENGIAPLPRARRMPGGLMRGPAKQSGKLAGAATFQFGWRNDFVHHCSPVFVQETLTIRAFPARPRFILRKEGVLVGRGRDTAQGGQADNLSASSRMGKWQAVPLWMVIMISGRYIRSRKMAEYKGS